MGRASSISSWRGPPIGSLEPTVPQAGTANPMPLHRRAGGTEEWLRTGSLLPYNASLYASSIAARPSLGRYGLVQQISPLGAVNDVIHLAWDQTNSRLYAVVCDTNGGAFRHMHTTTPLVPDSFSAPFYNFGGWSSSVSLLSFRAGGGGWVYVVRDSGAISGRQIVTGSGVAPGHSVRADITGSGGWGSRNIGFNGTTWLYLGGPGLAAAWLRTGASPDGAWTSAGTTNPPANEQYIENNGSVWLSSDIKTSTDGAAWTTRSLATMTGFDRHVAMGSLCTRDIVWTGTHFILPVRNTLTGAIRFQRSTNGVTWALDAQDSGLAVTPGLTYAQHITSDRAGRVWLMLYESANGAPSSSTGQTTGLFYSTDHGVSWSPLPWSTQMTPTQPDMMTADGGFLFMQGRFRSSLSGQVGVAQASSLLVTPNHIGVPEALTVMANSGDSVPFYVRIR